jgi:glutamine amidotransferase
MIVIVDYKMGNLGSVANMLKKIGAKAIISRASDDILGADKLILPGVGAFDNGMRNIAELGLRDVLNKKVIEMRAPVLGICLGMQLLTEKSEEGVLPGLGWVPAETVRFRFGEQNQRLKIPHMGWNTIEFSNSSSLLSNMPPDSRFYFVHSYYVKCRNDRNVAAWTTHGHAFCSIVNKAHIWGAQFHPEKSHRFGMQLLANFSRDCHA